MVGLVGARGTALNWQNVQIESEEPPPNCPALGGGMSSVVRSLGRRFTGAVMLAQ